jgi:hypothetical protein
MTIHNLFDTPHPDAPQEGAGPRYLFDSTSFS